MWELRRYCTLAEEPKQQKLHNGVAAPLVRISGGYLEELIDNPKSLAREPLLWQNAFFGTRTKKRVRLNTWFKGHNAPLYLNPQILDEVLKYVYIPKELANGYRTHVQS